MQSKAQINSSSSSSNGICSGSGDVGGGGYEDTDPVEVERARLRAQQPVPYATLNNTDVNLEELYSRPIKRR